MDIQHLVDRLEELFNQSRGLPLTHSVVVDEDRMLDIIDQMRVSIPDEIKKAQQILVQRDRILAQAQEEATRTINLAREKSEQMIQKENLMAEAQTRGDELIAQSRTDAENTRHEADQYVLETLMKLEMELDRTLSQVRNGIRAIQKD